MTYVNSDNARKLASRYSHARMTAFFGMEHRSVVVHLVKVVAAPCQKRSTIQSEVRLGYDA